MIIIIMTLLNNQSFQFIVLVTMIDNERCATLCEAAHALWILYLLNNVNPIYDNSHYHSYYCGLISHYVAVSLKE